MAEQQAPEVAKQCAACKKPVKKIRRYYRDGKYYCSQNCYRKSKAGGGKSAEAAAA